MKSVGLIAESNSNHHEGGFSQKKPRIKDAYGLFNGHLGTGDGGTGTGIIVSNGDDREFINCDDEEDCFGGSGSGDGAFDGYPGEPDIHGGDDWGTPGEKDSEYSDDNFIAINRVQI